MQSKTSPRIFHLIDPPDDLAPMAEWKRFVRELEDLDPRTPEVEEELRRARAHIAEKAH